MGLLQVIDDAPGYLKATFQGPQGSGKTRTAAEVACTARELFGSKKPIAFFDTEIGSDYIAGLITERTGQKPLRVKTRAFKSLMEVVKECVDGASDVLIVDSITHVWRELQDSYMRQMNETRIRNNWRPKTKMDIQDIMQIKKLWEAWPDQFLNSPIHIIVCGREGNEWGNEENEETGKRELVQTGKKMKVEAEFGYEASLMVAMAAVQQQEVVVRKKGGVKEREGRKIVNVATVLKDRFDVINGEMFEFPTGKDFLPHLKLLNPQLHRPVNTENATAGTLPEMTEDGGWAKEKRTREILCEEIQGEIQKHYPGQTAKEKACKAQLVDLAFGTRSWIKVEGMNSDDLRAGLSVIKDTMQDKSAFESQVAAA